MTLGCRLTVGRLTLDQVVGVRIPASQPIKNGLFKPVTRKAAGMFGRVSMILTTTFQSTPRRDARVLQGSHPSNRPRLQWSQPGRLHQRVDFRIREGWITWRTNP